MDRDFATGVDVEVKSAIRRSLAVTATPATSIDADKRAETPTGAATRVTHTDDRLLARLADARSNKVIFVSHCMLDENVRYLGGAFHSGAPPEAAQLVARGRPLPDAVP